MRLEPLIAARAKDRKWAGKKADLPPTLAEGETRDELAKVAGISHGTLAKVKVIAEKAPEDIKAKLRRRKAVSFLL